MVRDTRSYMVDMDTKKAKFAVTHFTSEEFFGFWPEFERMLDSVPHTWKYWSKEYIQNAVSNQTMQVWGVGRPPLATCIFLTQIGIYPSFRSLTILWSGGAFDDEMVPLLEAAWTHYAQINDCSEVEIRGRDGWGPKLKPLGFKKQYSSWTRSVRNRSIN